MLGTLYARWMIAWETALTTRDQNRVERPLEWGFEHLTDIGGAEAAARVERGAVTAEEAMRVLNDELAADPARLFGYRTPADFRLEMRHPELYPTNVRPETLEQEREWRRRAEVGEIRREPFLRWTSAVRTLYPENNEGNARWYPAEPRKKGDGSIGPRQAIIVMPQWNADAFSHNALCEIFQRFGIAGLRLSKPYHDVRRPAELERSDYAVSANVGRTIEAARQAVADVRSCVDWLKQQGYEQIGVLGTSLGSCYAFLAAAMDPRLRVCIFNHASTWFGDVVWTGQSTRHVRSAWERAGLTQESARAVLGCVSPGQYMREFAAPRDRQVLAIHATWDLTFLEEFSQDAIRKFREHGVRFEERVLPCGHYTTGETPYKYLDGWYMGSFVWRAFREMREGRI